MKTLAGFINQKGCDFMNGFIMDFPFTDDKKSPWILW